MSKNIIVLFLILGLILSLNTVYSLPSKLTITYRIDLDGNLTVETFTQHPNPNNISIIETVDFGITPVGFPPEDCYMLIGDETKKEMGLWRMTIQPYKVVDVKSVCRVKTAKFNMEGRNEYGIEGGFSKLPKHINQYNILFMIPKKQSNLQSDWKIRLVKFEPFYSNQYETNDHIILEWKFERPTYKTGERIEIIFSYFEDYSKIRDGLFLILLGIAIDRILILIWHIRKD